MLGWPNKNHGKTHEFHPRPSFSGSKVTTWGPYLVVEGMLLDTVPEVLCYVSPFGGIGSDRWPMRNWMVQHCKLNMTHHDPACLLQVAIPYRAHVIPNHSIEYLSYTQTPNICLYRTLFGVGMYVMTISDFCLEIHLSPLTHGNSTRNNKWHWASQEQGHHQGLDESWWPRWRHMNSWFLRTQTYPRTGAEHSKADMARGGVGWEILHQLVDGQTSHDNPVK